jgi:hypothetical protein
VAVYNKAIPVNSTPDATGEYESATNPNSGTANDTPTVKPTLTEASPDVDAE